MQLPCPTAKLVTGVNQELSLATQMELARPQMVPAQLAPTAPRHQSCQHLVLMEHSILRRRLQMSSSVCRVPLATCARAQETRLPLKKSQLVSLVTMVSQQVAAVKAVPRVCTVLWQVSSNSSVLWATTSPTRTEATASSAQRVASAWWVSARPARKVTTASDHLVAWLVLLVTLVAYINGWFNRCVRATIH